MSQADERNVQAFIEINLLSLFGPKPKAFTALNGLSFLPAAKSFTQTSKQVT